ncbi:MAG TPA: D-glycerate dehydrogenase [Candidatus Binataceae bacterium]|jgi:glyoxylate reductase
MATLARPKAFVTRRIFNGALLKLSQRLEIDLWEGKLPPPYPALAARAASADALLTMVTDRIDAPLLASALRLRVVSQVAVGVDNIDLAECSRKGIAVGHTPGVLTETTADLAFALLAATARRITEADRYVREGKWRTWGPEILLGREIHGATLGILGFGAIGHAMARRAAGFGMRVLYCARKASARAIEASGIDGNAIAVDLAELLRSSDFVSIHLPLTAQTRLMIGAREIAAMKPGAILINTARGPIVDQRALCAALASGHLAGAGLDVTESEPIDPSDPLLALPSVVITPHIGSASDLTRSKMADIAVDNILDVFDGRPPRFCANREAIAQA